MAKYYGRIRNVKEPFNANEYLSEYEREQLEKSKAAYLNTMYDSNGNIRPSRQHVCHGPIGMHSFEGY